MTVNILRISMGGPILPASGSVTRLGTKKTGNHLASNAAPGLKSEKIVDPKGKRSMLAKRAQHPPNEEGKLMDKAWKSFRKPTSKAIKSAVEIKELVSVGALWLLFDDDDEEEEEEEEREEEHRSVRAESSKSPTRSANLLSRLFERGRSGGTSASDGYAGSSDAESDVGSDPERLDTSQQVCD
mmetsp:Transcript_46828/g.131701  ORF Transcript_46828/g.131701 Transcript_46828/m.131701 type:complete len:184 (-) Transcript_46828:61-612(-)